MFLEDNSARIFNINGIGKNNLCTLEKKEAQKIIRTEHKPSENYLGCCTSYNSTFRDL